MKRLLGRSPAVGDGCASRPASYPFLSGDTFRAMCDVIFDETTPGPFKAVSVHPGDVVFCKVDRLVELRDTLVGSRSARDIAKAGATLVVHNGDVLPPPPAYADLLSVFDHVFSVNATSDLVALGVEALPIGIENAHWRGCGARRFFQTPSPSIGDARPASERPISVLASFRVETNSKVRAPLRALVQGKGNVWVEPSDDLQYYFSAVRRSRFVLSPPGNGPDCHRTWEAVYLGAIPVVLSGVLADEVFETLPILVVSDYESFLAMSPREMDEIARSLLTRSSGSAYFPYWESRVWG